MSTAPGPKPLTPPYSQAHELFALSQVNLPAGVREDNSIIVPAHDLPRFFSAELKTLRLNEIHGWLWLAGLPVPARHLQRQTMMNRTIFLTERPDEHLVWHQDRLFLKPLPDYLLCRDFWEQNLLQDEQLYRSACGFLLSYVWLIAYKSDFNLGVKTGLLPENIDWPAWTGFVGDFLANINVQTLEQVDRRYQFGELRMSRLNLITRYLVPRLWSWKNYVHGFMSSSTWYTAFFERHFGWLLAAFLYISIVLTALQVGLATEVLEENQMFQDMSYGITLTSIAGIFLGIVLMVLVWLTLFCYHVLSSVFFARQVETKRRQETDA